MSGEGKYSVYEDTIPGPQSGGTDPKKIAFLSEVFKGGPSLNKDEVLKRAKELLTPPVQKDGMGVFPGGQVSLDYSGAPDLNDVKFSKPGDPSTPFTPDVRSPGSAVPADQLGSVDTSVVTTNVIPASGDPGAKVSDFAPNYVPGAPNTGTKSPELFSQKVSSQTLGTPGAMSTSTDNSGGEIYK